MKQANTVILIYLKSFNERESKMEAIEFNYESCDDVIKIPKCYKDWFKKSFKVILLAQELPHNFKPTQRRLPKGAGCYRSGRFIFKVKKV
ncbi:MAG: hypothetical protein DRQ57_13210 [Gammaproteobacteria bacterium]|nr:MAG: hypothetical protein DRQ57_13210 [Gammaproteobacteria bacterium]